MVVMTFVSCSLPVRFAGPSLPALTLVLWHPSSPALPHSSLNRLHFPTSSLCSGCAACVSQYSRTLLLSQKASSPSSSIRLIFPSVGVTLAATTTECSVCGGHCLVCFRCSSWRLREAGILISRFLEEERERDDVLTVPQLLYEGYVFQIKSELIPKPKLIE